MLQKLPAEILLLVLGQLQRIDLKQLCEVSKTLYYVATPKLYENTVVRAPYERFLETVEVGPLLQTYSHTLRTRSRTSRTLSQEINPLQFATSVQVKSDFNYHLQQRCPHHYVDYRRTSYEDPGLEKLIASLMPLFRRLKEGSLRSFSWEMGTCIPAKILGRRGYLSRKQRSIESISLITDGPCYQKLLPGNTIDLSAFRSLLDISWTGLQKHGDFYTLAEALENNWEHFRELRLDFVNWEDEGSVYLGEFDEYNSFASYILGMESGVSEIQFPALRVLSLSAIPLEYMAEEIAYTLNITGLSSLTLRNCPGSKEFLDAAIDSDQAILLKSLEFACETYEREYICGTLSTFLQTFHGLRDLFISLSEHKQTPTLDLWRSIGYHKSTLTRFVHHQTRWDNGSSSLFEEGVDRLDLSLSPADRASLDNSELTHPFAVLNLECIGLGCSPQFLKSILAPFTISQTLKILHVRKSGVPDTWDPTGRLKRSLLEELGLFTDNYSTMTDDDLGEESDSDSREPITHSTAVLTFLADLLEFADWAFGPNGLPTLEVLAFGDFSYGDRFNGHNLLFCRRNQPPRNPENDNSQQDEEGPIRTFRTVRRDDWELKDLIDRNMEFLKACPTTKIMTDIMSD